MPDYVRIDLGANYSFNTFSKAWKISADIQNVTNRKNINRQFYDCEKNKVVDNYYQGLVVNVNLMVEF